MGSDFNGNLCRWKSCDLSPNFLSFLINVSVSRFSPIKNVKRNLFFLFRFQVFQNFSEAFAGKSLLCFLQELKMSFRSKSTASAPKVKRRVGKYELGRTIGEGAFAKVRFAKNSETGDPVAIKILDKEKVLKHKLVEQVSFEFFVSPAYSLTFLCFVLLVYLHGIVVRIRISSQ